jgi:hypothetical protein
LRSAFFECRRDFHRASQEGLLGDGESSSLSGTEQISDIVNQTSGSRER